MKAPVMLLLALVLGFTACKKENKGKASQDVTTVAQTGPENPDNPFDSVGYWHNEMLYFIDSHRSIQKVDFFKARLLIEQFCKEHGWPDPILLEIQQVSETVNAAQNDFHLLIAHSPLSPSVKRIVSDLWRELKRLSDDSCSYNQIKNLIVSNEAKVQEYKLSNSDQISLLKITSIVRWSSYYWMKNDLRQTMNPRTPQKSFWEWISVTVNDVGGFIAEFSVENAALCSDYIRSFF